MQEVYIATIAAKDLYGVVGSLEKMVEDYGCKLVFTHKGLSVVAVNSANTMMVTLDVDYIALKAKGQPDITVGIDCLWQIAKFLSPGKKSGAPVKITIMEEPCRIAKEGNNCPNAEDPVPMVRKMRLRYDVIPGANVKADFGLVDPEVIRRDFKVPEVQLQSIWYVPAAHLKNMLNLATFRKGKVALEITDQMAHLITLDAAGQQDAWFSLGSEYASAYQSNPKECLTLFDPAYLKNALTYAPAKAQICLENNSEYPIRMSYSLAAGIKVSYFLAPRIEQE